MRNKLGKAKIFIRKKGIVNKKTAGKEKNTENDELIGQFQGDRRL